MCPVPSLTVGLLHRPRAVSRESVRAQQTVSGVTYEKDPYVDSFRGLSCCSCLMSHRQDSHWRGPKSKKGRRLVERRSEDGRPHLIRRGHADLRQTSDAYGTKQPLPS